MMTVYHVNEHRGTKTIVHATGPEQWLGDAYYFWQDLEFAEEWAKNSRNNYKLADVYQVDLDLDFYKEEDVIDTVFNENDYYKFIEKVEYFASIYFAKFARKPSLIDFNNFIQDNNFSFWQRIKAIRFQDLPSNDKKSYLHIKGFYYKKRIQVAVFDISTISSCKLFRIIENQ